MADKVFSVDFDPDKFISGVESALKELDKFEKGTAEFDAAMKKLQQTVDNVSFTKPISAINQLRTALTTGEFKLNLSNVNKSIDEVVKDLPALTKLLNDLKKTLATTTDGTEFNELRKTIQLVESSIAELGGQTQQTADTGFISLRRQIKEGRLELERLEDAGLQNTAMYQKLQREVAQLTDRYADNQAAIRALASDTLALDAGIQAIQGITAIFQVYEGVLASVGVENEDLQKIQTKLLAIMNIATGVQTIYNLLQKESTIRIVADTAAKAIAAVATRLFAKATEEAAAAQVALKVALASTPWGAILAIVAAVAGALVVFTSNTESAATAQDDLNNSLEQYNRILEDNLQNIKDAEEKDIERQDIVKNNERNIFNIKKKSLEDQLALTKESLDKNGELEKLQAQLDKDILLKKFKDQESADKAQLLLTERKNRAQENARVLEQRIEIINIQEGNRLVKQFEAQQEAKIASLQNYVDFLNDYNDEIRQINIGLKKTESEILLPNLYKESINFILDAENDAISGFSNLTKAYKNTVREIEKIEREQDPIQLIKIPELTKQATVQLEKIVTAGFDGLNLRGDPFKLKLNKVTERFYQSFKDTAENIQDTYKNLSFEDALKDLDFINNTFLKGLNEINIQSQKSAEDARRAYRDRNKITENALKDGLLLTEKNLESLKTLRTQYEAEEDAISQGINDANKANDIAKRAGLLIQLDGVKKRLQVIDAGITEGTSRIKQYQYALLKNEEQYNKDLIYIIKKRNKDIADLSVKFYEDTIEINRTILETSLLESENRIKQATLAFQKLYEEGIINYRNYTKNISNAEKKESQIRIEERKKEIDDEITSINKIIGLLTDTSKIEAYKKRLAELRGLRLDLDLQGLDEFLLTPEQRKKLESDVDFVAEAISKIFGFKKDDPRVKNLRNEINDGIQNTINLLNEQTAAELRAADAAVEAQQKRVDEALKIAEQGNAKYLKEEEDRLKELENKREAAARRQLEIDAAVSASQILLALAQGVAKGVQSAQTAGGVGIGIATIVASIAAALAGGSALVQSLQFPNFAEGTDAAGRLNVTAGSDKLNRGRYRSGKDTIPAMLDEGEAVISRRETDLYQPTIRAIRRGLIPHDVMNGFVKNFRNGINYDKIGNAVKISTTNTDMVETNNRLKRLEGVLGNIESALGGMKYNITMDSNGFAASIQQHINKQAKINKA